VREGAEMTQEARKLMAFVIRELSTLKYGYKTIVEGCYDVAIQKYKFAVPIESKAEIVNKVIECLNNSGVENDR
jgi:hypothetical protein